MNLAKQFWLFFVVMIVINLCILGGLAMLIWQSNQNVPPPTSALFSMVTVAIVFNTLMALGFVYNLGRNTAERLSVIEDNLRRFRRRFEMPDSPMPSVSLATSPESALHPRTKGNDEIGRLDDEFRTFTQALKEAWQKDKEIFANLPLALLACSSDGVIEFINPKASDVLKCEPKDLLGRSIFNLDPSEKLKSLWYEWHPLASNRLTVQRQDQSELPVEISLAAYENKGQKKFLVALMDVSAREELERFRQQLVSMVSHDLKTPLTAIGLLTNRLETHIQQEQSDRALATINSLKEELSRLYRLTTDILDLSKIQTTQIRASMSNVSVAKLIESALNSIIWLADERDVGIMVLPCPTGLTVTTDNDRVIQILVNFMSNAIKFSPEGSQIVIESTVDHDSLRIAVRDQGRGIEKHQLETVFEPFKQLQPADKYIGTGLGLSICKLLADSLNARIEVESDAGSGSCFTLVLPT
jgi:PAS domain S-box-containing protein